MSCSLDRSNHGARRRRPVQCASAPADETGALCASGSRHLARAAVISER
jgi:hypothetical protein